MVIPMMNTKDRKDVTNILKQLNANIKNKNSLNKCDKFCKED